MKNKNKILLFSTTLCLLLNSNPAQAEWTYGGKFLATTASGCAAGVATGFMIGNNGGYDSQPKQILTYMGGVTGCLTGAIFAYFFYDDPSKDLAQRNEQMQHVNDQLQLQLQATVNGNHLQKLNGSQGFSGNTGQFNINSILSNMQIAQIDPSKIGGLGNIQNGLKKCDIIYPLWMGRNGFVSSSSDKNTNEDTWIPVSPHYAIKAWQFYYSKDGCFEADKRYGFFENVMPGLTDNLQKQLEYTLGMKEEYENLKK